jgi:hypothetical protein
MDVVARLIRFHRLRFLNHDLLRNLITYTCMMLDECKCIKYMLWDVMQ